MAVADGTGCAGRGRATVRTSTAPAGKTAVAQAVHPAVVVEQDQTDVGGPQLGRDQVADPGADVLDGGGVGEGLRGASRVWLRSKEQVLGLVELVAVAASRPAS